uniref:Peptidase S1 domain-containing protein n=1 Tax=Glossina pallidipes TaxID=7398 RepID=A0A1A9ZHL0_GLOPL
MDNELGNDDDKRFEIIERNEELEKGVNNRTQICATSFSGNNGTCLGDSGGALFVNHPEFPCQFPAVGIMSFGEGGCGHQGIPSVYTRLSANLNAFTRFRADSARQNERNILATSAMKHNEIHFCRNILMERE